MNDNQYSYNILKDKYINLWKNMKLNESTYSKIAYLSEKINRIKHMYEKYDEIIPPLLLAFFHYTNNDFNFGTHFHNTDLLSNRTVSYPKNRPIKDDFRYIWKESLDDFVEYIKPLPEKWTITSYLFVVEKYENFKYRQYKINSPTLWAGSNNYNSGYIDENNVFIADKIYEKIGIASLMKYNINHDKIHISIDTI